MSKYFAFVIALVVALGFGFAGTSDAADGAKLFKKQCKKCHKLTAKKGVGPGLKGVSAKRSEKWLRAWLADPQAVWEANDEETQDLKKWKKGKDKKPKTSMKIKKLSDGDIDALIKFMADNG